mgnify:FL=1
MPFNILANLYLLKKLSIITLKLLTYNILYAIIKPQKKGNSNQMPVISRFYGMVIKMYFIASEHNPPHIHVIYGEYIGILDIRNSEMITGDLPAKALAIAKEWTSRNKDALLQMWQTQDIKPLPPIE